MKLLIVSLVWAAGVRGELSVINSNMGRSGLVKYEEMRRVGKYG